MTERTHHINFLDPETSPLTHTELMLVEHGVSKRAIHLIGSPALYGVDIAAIGVVKDVWSLVGKLDGDTIVQESDADGAAA